MKKIEYAGVLAVGADGNLKVQPVDSNGNVEKARKPYWICRRDFRFVVQGPNGSEFSENCYDKWFPQVGEGVVVGHEFGSTVCGKSQFWDGAPTVKIPTRLVVRGNKVVRILLEDNPATPTVTTTATSQATVSVTNAKVVVIPPAPKIEVGHRVVRMTRKQRQELGIQSLTVVSKFDAKKRGLSVVRELVPA